MGVADCADCAFGALAGVQRDRVCPRGTEVIGRGGDFFTEGNEGNEGVEGG
jgi:hypothetical protein